jgi:hypothetical protein
VQRRLLLSIDLIVSHPNVSYPVTIKIFNRPIVSFSMGIVIRHLMKLVLRISKRVACCSLLVAVKRGQLAMERCERFATDDLNRLVFFIKKIVGLQSLLDSSQVY